MEEDERRGLMMNGVIVPVYLEPGYDSLSPKTALFFRPNAVVYRTKA